MKTNTDTVDVLSKKVNFLQLKLTKTDTSSNDLNNENRANTKCRKTNLPQSLNFEQGVSSSLKLQASTASEFVSKMKRRGCGSQGYI